MEYKKEKQEALAALAAAVASHDRLGDFNVPLADAAEVNIRSWIDGFLTAHTHNDPTAGVHMLKELTPQLEKAIPKIIERSFVWMKQHNSLTQKIRKFQVDLGTALDLARA